MDNQSGWVGTTMSKEAYTLRRVLRSTALTGFAVALLAPAVVTAFDPNAGSDMTAAPTVKRTRPLPSTAPLITPMPKLVFPAAPVNRQIPSGNMNATAPTVYADVAPSAPAPATSFPPVDPAVEAQAQRELNAMNTAAAPATVIAAPPRFVAPAPLAASSSVGAAVPVVNSSVGAAAPATVVSPKPVEIEAVAPNVVATPAQTGLSPASKTILNTIPSKLNSVKPATGKLAINRMSPEIQAIAKPEAKVESYDAVGLSIKVARPGLDTNYELNRAYTSLMGGDTQAALETYKNVLTTEPDNQDALFGLAATYHRLGEIDKARPYYGQLLKVNPMHREGLNNFLALVSDEAPHEALAELERLEQRNPDFSPIPAQQSLLLSKLGYFDQAKDKMLRAIELAPDNLSYKYNLAVMLDRHGNYVDASALYRLLIDASLKGERVPASVETLQKRLNFITTATAPQAMVGG